MLRTSANINAIGTMLNISTGCEPLFALYYNRKTESLNGGDVEKTYKVYTGIAKEYMERFEVEDLPEYFNTSGDLNWRDRVDFQSALQKHVDTAISSTINLHNKTSVEETEQLYLYAWEKGLKGVTIFRDGCARLGILTTDNTNNKKETSEKSNNQKLERGMIIKVDNNTVGKERHLTTGCGSLHCAAFFDPNTGELLETYLSKGSTGGCQSNLAAVSRLMSLSARAGVDVYTIVDQLTSCMACPSYAVRTATKHDTSKGSSCPVAVGNALIDMYKEMQGEISDEQEDINIVKKQKTNNVTTTVNKIICPECGEPLVASGGCFQCTYCHYSKCE